MTEKEYNQCVKDHSDHVFRFILKNLRNTEDARDVVQTAFEKMWTSRAAVDPSRCKSFLFTVAYHQMIDHLRRGKQVMSEEAGEQVAVYNSQSGHLKKILEKALGRLNDVQRSLVLLKDYEGYSYEEIGEITGLNASQVKVYLHRARIQLKNYIVRPENILEQ
ncbi:MAG: RNA polymerase sigma factor [Chitinophagaceae bacterium]|nr:RNA polymerase sigma factor [Chitinophagaceae bacterium]